MVTRDTYPASPEPRLSPSKMPGFVLSRQLQIGRRSVLPQVPRLFLRMVASEDQAGTVVIRKLPHAPRVGSTLASLVKIVKGKKQAPTYAFRKTPKPRRTLQTWLKLRMHTARPAAFRKLRVPIVYDNGAVFVEPGLGSTGSRSPAFCRLCLKQPAVRLRGTPLYVRGLPKI